MKSNKNKFTTPPDKLNRRFKATGYVANKKGVLVRIGKKKRRNDPCDCGCGKKSKNCTIAPVK